MLTRDDIKKILLLKEKGYSMRKAALELGINSKTAHKYWGEKFQSMEDNPYFKWIRCPKCRAYFPAPKFLKKFQCPSCEYSFWWKKLWYKPLEGFLGPNEAKT